MGQNHVLDVPIFSSPFKRNSNYAECVGTGATIFLAAIMEYMASEVLELACNAAHEKKNHLKVKGGVEYKFGKNKEVVPENYTDQAVESY
uniref:(California timema) hypothetical protein n=1 Tax=Timema californicum TaxID=61474 RepID=A0A7R9P7N0_TIMCA|nr:unnamed protein product [Timema californicum]